jgi:hypothetical protein
VPWRIDGQADLLGGANSLTVQMNRDSAMAGGSLTWTDEAVISTSPRESVLGPDTFTSAYRIDTKIVGTNADTVPIRLNALRIRADINLELPQTTEYNVTIKRHQELRGGGLEDQDHEAVFQALLALGDSEDAVPVALINEEGRRKVVQVLQGMTWTKFRDQDDDYRYDVTFHARELYESGTSADSGFITDSEWLTDDDAWTDVT